MSWPGRCRVHGSHAEYFAASGDQDTEVLCPGPSVRKDAQVNAIFDKAIGVLGHVELFEPVRNLLHRGNQRSARGLSKADEKHDREGAEQGNVVLVGSHPLVNLLGVGRSDAGGGSKRNTAVITLRRSVPQPKMDVVRVAGGRSRNHRSDRGESNAAQRTQSASRNRCRRNEG